MSAGKVVPTCRGANEKHARPMAVAELTPAPRWMQLAHSARLQHLGLVRREMARGRRVRPEVVREHAIMAAFYNVASSSTGRSKDIV